MNAAAAIIILIVLLCGPLILAPLERNLEAYCFVVGLVAVTLAHRWNWPLVSDAASEPVLISVVVIVAGILFGYGRPLFDRTFQRLRRHIRRPLLTTLAVLIIALLSSLITAIVAALMLVEMVGLVRLEPARRTHVIIAGCFAVGLGAALTPIGEPLATLVAHAEGLRFWELFEMLAPYVIPGVVAASVLAGWLARGDYDETAAAVRVHESIVETFVQGVKVFIFIAGLVLISDAYAPMAERLVPQLSRPALFWVNIVSAALDNATLVALEIHHMERQRAIEALMSLLISGGMLIQGNIPNIVSAGIFHIPSSRWARMGVPLGLLMLGIYFAVFVALG
jgi:predicted cation transporter